MDHVELSRLQFALTTLYHINWAALSIGLTLLLVVMEGLWLRTGEEIYYRQTRFWGKLFLLNFAMGAMSGLPLEFQFGTNWGPFSAATHGFFGNILGFETTLAFMLEAGFLGIMLFGWQRVSRKVHFFATCMVALGASGSAFWIMVANAWMHTPAGGQWVGGRFVPSDYLAALFNPDMPWSVSHMWVAAVEAALFLVGGLAAWQILKKRQVPFYARSLKVAVVLLMVFTPLQIWLGDGSGLAVAKYQPAKLGAIEAHWVTNPPGTGAPFNVLAWPNWEKQDNDWSLAIPDGLSLIITRSLTGQVKGLREFPPADQPPLALTFYSFRVMAGIGFLLFFLMLWTMWRWGRGALAPECISGQKWLLRSWIAALPLGFLAIETGWITREVGRQPWIIYGVMRTSEGASVMPPATVATSLLVYAVIYTLLFFTLIVFAWRLIDKGPDMSSPVPAPQDRARRRVTGTAASGENQP